MMKLLSEREDKLKRGTKEEVIADLRSVQEEYPDKYISRNFYRTYGKYSDSAWDCHFGTFKEFRRQAGLELTRHQHKIEQNIAKHASHDHYVEFFKKEVLPFHDKYKKNFSNKEIATLLICSDVHDKEVDEFCLSVFIDTCRLQQPDIIVLNGDIFDLYEFSNYSMDIRECDLVGRIKFIRENLFRPLRKYCPNAQIDFIMGNHEFRLLRHIADRSPYLRILMGDLLNISFSDIFGLDEFQINWYSKVDFKAFSYHQMKKEVKENYKVYFDCYVVSHIWDKKYNMSGTSGHHHRIEYKSDFNLHSGNISWVQTPAMHKKNAEYLTGPCKWDLGFLKTYINIKQKQVIQEVIEVHDTWAIVDGVLYTRK